MIDAHAAGFKSSGEDARGKDAQHANGLKDAGERTPRPDTWFSLRRGLRGYASTRSAPRPQAARRGRKTTMHDTMLTDEDTQRFHRLVHRFHSVSLAAVKSKSQDVVTTFHDFTDFPNSFRGGTRGRPGARPPARARAPATTALPPERNGEIGEIGETPHAVPRLSFHRTHGNGSEIGSEIVRWSA